jgi:hypothetical protein
VLAFEDMPGAKARRARFDVPLHDVSFFCLNIEVQSSAPDV